MHLRAPVQARHTAPMQKPLATNTPQLKSPFVAFLLNVLLLPVGAGYLYLESWGQAAASTLRRIGCVVGASILTAITVEVAIQLDYQRFPDWFVIPSIVILIGPIAALVAWEARHAWRLAAGPAARQSVCALLAWVAIGLTGQLLLLALILSPLASGLAYGLACC